MHKLHTHIPTARSAPGRLELRGIRFFYPPVDDGGAGGGGGGNYTPPATQADLDKLLGERAARATRAAEAKFEGFDDIKAKAEKWEEHEKKSKNQSQNEKREGDEKNVAQTPPGLDEAAVQDRISKALSERDAKHAAERAQDKLGAALKGRTFEPSKLFGLDFTKFVKDNKPDESAIADWVKDNSEQGPEETKTKRRDASQGNRDHGAGSSSVQSGRDRFANERKKPTKEE